jgi:sorbitol-specific phosphotransferase system component IIBC
MIPVHEDGYWPPLYIKAKVITLDQRQGELIGCTGQLNVGVYPDMKCETVFVQDQDASGNRRVYLMAQLHSWEEVTK